jgi:ubiquitin carboxyl-terminal hydrolase 47
MTPEFREALFEWKYDPAVHGEETYCIPLQLQLLFARLQLSAKGAVETTGLTRSFGWESAEMYVQHDIGELINVMLEHIERAADPESFLFKSVSSFSGEISNVITCMSCGTKTRRAERFSSLPLEIKGCKTLTDSFNK